MKLIFFSKSAKFYIHFQNEKKILEIFFVLEIMAFEALAGTYLNYDENTCDRGSTCYQTILRFQI